MLRSSSLRSQAGRTALTHQALDVHPNRRAADYLRHMLTAGGALPARDEALARVERWSREVLGAIGEPADRRLVQAYLTWRVLRRLRRRSETSPGRRTVTNDARHRVIAVVTFLAWLRRHDLTLASCGQGHVETWLATGPAAYDVRDFLAWAGDRKHCAALEIPGPQHKPAPRPVPNSGELGWLEPGLRWNQISPMLCWGGRVFHGTAAWRNHGLIIFRFCFVEHLSSCAVQLPRLVAGSAARPPPGGNSGISSSGTRFAPRVPRAGQG